uniref:Uncharacterized protein n=1 Tax=Caenorhabditis japonica TaxID=281687 RepID=A0A8R1DTM0_CAEJA
MHLENHLEYVVVIAEVQPLQEVMDQRMDEQPDEDPQLQPVLLSPEERRLLLQMEKERLATDLQKYKEILYSLSNEAEIRQALESIGLDFDELIQRMLRYGEIIRKNDFFLFQTDRAYMQRALQGNNAATAPIFAGAGDNEVGALRALLGVRPEPILNEEGNLADFQRLLRRHFVDRERMRSRHRIAVIATAPMECEMCKKQVQQALFLLHYMQCLLTTTVNKNVQTMVIHKFLSSKFVTKIEIHDCVIRHEIAYYKVWGIPEESPQQPLKALLDLDCVKCATFADHMAGKCLNDNMESVLLKELMTIADSIMAHFEAYLDLKKVIGLQKIEDKHNAHFNEIESCFNDDSTDDETESLRERMWYDFRKTTIDEQMNEKRNYLHETSIEHKEMMSRQKECLRSDMSIIASKLSSTILANRRPENLPRVRQLVREDYVSHGIDAPPEFAARFDDKFTMRLGSATHDELDFAAMEHRRLRDAMAWDGIVNRVERQVLARRRRHLIAQVAEDNARVDGAL